MLDTQIYMITPTKYTNLDLSVVNIAGEIILYLKGVHIARYQEVLQAIQYQYGEQVKYVFLYAINFLYLLNVIEYNINGDVLKLLDKNENSI